jgi:hypothetical protein
MKKTALLAFILSFNSVFAQSLTDHIPANAQYVITLNTKNYAGKVEMKDICNLEFLRSLQTDGSQPGQHKMMASLFTKPEEYGVNLFPASYVFKLAQDSVNGWCYLFNLKDEKLFTQQVLKVLHTDGKADPILSTGGGFTSTKGGQLVVIWTKDFAMVLVKDAYSPYFYSSSSGLSDVNYASQTANDSSVVREIAREQEAADSVYQAELQEAKKAQKASGKLKGKRTGSGKGKQVVKKTTKTPEPVIVEEALRRQADSIAFVLTQQMANSNSGSGADTRSAEDMETQQSNCCIRKLNKLLNQNQTESVGGLRTFSQSQQGLFDIAVWMNYSDELIPGMNRYSGMQSKHSVDSLGTLPSLQKDNYSVAYFNFDKGILNFRHCVFLNPRMNYLAEEIYRKKGSKSFNKYIKGENLMGFATMSIHNEKTLQATRKILAETYAQTLGAEAKYVNGLLDITAVFMNEDVLYHLFKGNFAIALTDLKPFKTTFIQYNYDDNFNRTETRQEKTDILPEFVALADVGKEEEMQKILKAIEKMGGLKAEGQKDVYLIQIPGKFSFTVYLALSNHMLICTNNEDLVHNKLKSGYSKKEQMTTSQRKLITSYPLVYYWNAAKTLDLVSKQPEFNPSAKLMKPLLQIKDVLTDAQLTGVMHEGNTYTTTAQMHFSDTSISSLFSMVKVLNQFYLSGK